MNKKTHCTKFTLDTKFIGLHVRKKKAGDCGTLHTYYQHKRNELLDKPAKCTPAVDA